MVRGGRLLPAAAAGSTSAYVLPEVGGYRILRYSPTFFRQRSMIRSYAAFSTGWNSGHGGGGGPGSGRRDGSLRSPRAAAFQGLGGRRRSAGRIQRRRDSGRPLTHPRRAARPLRGLSALVDERDRRPAGRPQLGRAPTPTGDRFRRRRCAPESLPNAQSFAFVYIPAFGPDWRALVMQGVDRETVLNTGAVGHYSGPGTSFPWDASGNFALAGHRDGHGMIFRDLDQLKPGDKVYVQTQYGWYVYQLDREAPSVPIADVSAIAHSARLRLHDRRSLHHPDHMHPDLHRHQSFGVVGAPGRNHPCRPGARRGHARPVAARAGHPARLSAALPALVSAIPVNRLSAPFGAATRPGWRSA